jgi:hypothetical protein
MPYSADFAAEWIGKPDTGYVQVFTGMRTVRSSKDPNVVQLDGRRYVLEGKIHFKNGVTLSAKFEMDTSGFDLLVLNSVKVYKDGLWYRWYEPELVTALGAENSDEILPFTWTPSISIKYKTPPYPMRFHERTVDAVVSSVRLLHERKSLDLSNANSLLFFDPVYWQ